MSTIATQSENVVNICTIYVVVVFKEFSMKTGSVCNPTFIILNFELKLTIRGYINLHKIYKVNVCFKINQIKKENCCLVYKGNVFLLVLEPFSVHLAAQIQ